jgi:hypothetical protein
MRMRDEDKNGKLLSRVEVTLQSYPCKAPLLKAELQSCKAQVERGAAGVNKRQERRVAQVIALCAREKMCFQYYRSGRMKYALVMARPEARQMAPMAVACVPSLKRAIAAVAYITHKE